MLADVTTSTEAMPGTVAPVARHEGEHVSFIFYCFSSVIETHRLTRFIIGTASNKIAWPPSLPCA